MSDVVVVIGVGGMGEPIARRRGRNKRLLLADFNARALESAAQRLRTEGFDVTTHTVDVSLTDSVESLAVAASVAGPVCEVIHTAGLSPVQAPPAAILAVDLLGVALVLDTFANVVAEGATGVVIASMAAYTAPPLSPQQEGALALTPAEQLLGLPFLQLDQIADSGVAYGLSKRANQLRVQAASTVWRDRSARVNSISPGIIATSMGQEELGGPRGAVIGAMVEASAARRPGNAADIADAADFLLSAQSSYISGSDLLVDGGVIAALRSGKVSFPHLAFDKRLTAP